MPLKVKKKRVVTTRTMFTDAPNSAVRKKRVLKKKSKKKRSTNAEVARRTFSRNDPALAIWDMLKPFHNDEKSINIVLDCLSKRGLFTQAFVASPNMPLPEVLKLAVAKFVLQTCNAAHPRAINFNEFYETLKNLDEVQQLPRNEERGPIIRPSFKERYEAKIVKTDNSLNGARFVNYNIPKRVLSQYAGLMFEERLLRKLLRPQIYFDFDVKTDRKTYANLGRVVFQLFSEACPAVVLELVRICAGNRFKSLSAKKVFQNIWFEGEFQIQNSPILENRILTHNTNTLDHSIGPGIISFPKQCVSYYSNREIISFVVSFSPLKIPPTQQRIAFGVVHKGHYVLSEIQKLGTSYGKPRSRLRISKCGAINI